MTEHSPENARFFGGIEITRDFVDELVEEWHEHPDMPTSMEQFIKANTGWTEAEYEFWATSGVLPIPPEQTDPCPQCRGTGRDHDELCPACNGTGEL